MTENPGERVFQERYNSATYDLFDFILNRDPRDGTYRLSAYALRLCRLFQNTLFTEIKSDPAHHSVSTDGRAAHQR
ncbi:MAG: hypothetical protein WKG07_32595 [Hymenobacter sp.]